MAEVPLAAVFAMELSRALALLVVEKEDDPDPGDTAAGDALLPDSIVSGEHFPSL